MGENCPWLFGPGIDVMVGLRKHCHTILVVLGFFLTLIHTLNGVSVEFVIFLCGCFFYFQVACPSYSSITTEQLLAYDAKDI